MRLNMGGGGKNNKDVLGGVADAADGTDDDGRNLVVDLYGKGAFEQSSDNPELAKVDKAIRRLEDANSRVVGAILEDRVPPSDGDADDGKKAHENKDSIDAKREELIRFVLVQFNPDLQNDHSLATRIKLLLGSETARDDDDKSSLGDPAHIAYWLLTGTSLYKHLYSSPVGQGDELLSLLTEEERNPSKNIEGYVRVGEIIKILVVADLRKSPLKHKHILSVLIRSIKEELAEEEKSGGKKGK